MVQCFLTTITVSTFLSTLTNQTSGLGTYGAVIDWDIGPSPGNLDTMYNAFSDILFSNKTLDL